MIDAIRQPEYTGQNRCMPCTIANVLIGGVIGGLAMILSIPVGIGIVAISLFLIYFRGYLIPKTPELTKAYMPEPILELFGKGPDSHGVDIDGETILREIDVIEPCGDDICLTESFESAWRTSIDRVDLTDQNRVLAGYLGTDNYEIEDTKDGIILLSDDEPVVARESMEALVADIAAVPLVQERYDSWNNHTLAEKDTILRSLRTLLKQCPACDETLQISSESYESCCSEQEVVRIQCGDCQSNIAEVAV